MDLLVQEINYMWIKHEEDTYMPDWLKSNLKSTCTLCGSPMMNYYNDDGRCTNRKCSNDVCPGMIAARADNIRQMVNIKGIGYAGCLEFVKTHKIIRPIEILKYLGVRPSVSLGVFLRMQCWEGVDSALETEMQRNGIADLDTLFEKYHGKYAELVMSHKKDLEETAVLVRLPQKVSIAPEVVSVIMITGTPVGFNTKEQFINSVNEMCQGKIQTIHQATKRQSGVDYLIREPGSTTRGKYEAALRAGIPIVTSEEYIKILVLTLAKIEGRPMEEIMKEISEHGHILLKD